MRNDLTILFPNINECYVNVRYLTHEPNEGAHLELFLVSRSVDETLHNITLGDDGREPCRVAPDGKHWHAHPMHDARGDMNRGACITIDHGWKDVVDFAQYLAWGAQMTSDAENHECNLEIASEATQANAVKELTGDNDYAIKLHVPNNDLMRMEFTTLTHNEWRLEKMALLANR